MQHSAHSSSKRLHAAGPTKRKAQQRQQQKHPKGQAGRQQAMQGHQARPATVCVWALLHQPADRLPSFIGLAATRQKQAPTTARTNKSPLRSTTATQSCKANARCARDAQGGRSSTRNEGCAQSKHHRPAAITRKGCSLAHRARAHAIVLACCTPSCGTQVLQRYSSTTMTV